VTPVATSLKDMFVRGDPGCLVRALDGTCVLISVLPFTSPAGLDMTLSYCRIKGNKKKKNASVAIYSLSFLKL
jgi:hypothetical protein